MRSRLRVAPRILGGPVPAASVEVGRVTVPGPGELVADEIEPAADGIMDRLEHRRAPGTYQGCQLTAVVDENQRFRGVLVAKGGVGRVVRREVRQVVDHLGGRPAVLAVGGESYPQPERCS